MEELAKGEYGRVHALFREIDFQRPAVYAVLEARQPGRVFVDHRKRPTGALIWSDWCYVAGSVTSASLQAALVDFLRREVMPGTEHLLVHAFTAPWRDAMERALGAYGVRRVQRTVFDWDPAGFHALHGD